MRMISTMRRYQTCFLIAGMLMLTTAYAVNAQRNEKVFAVVPESQRAQLVERLKLYVDYQRSKDYEQLYGLLSKATIDRVFKGQTLPQFVAAFRKGDEERTSVTILDFKVTNVEKTTEDGVDLYKIYGDAKLRQHGEEVDKQIVIGAQWQDANWYFTTLSDVLDN
jgi:hypothetical protein